MTPRRTSQRTAARLSMLSTAPGDEARGTTASGTAATSRYSTRSRKTDVSETAMTAALGNTAGTFRDRHKQFVTTLSGYKQKYATRGPADHVGDETAEAAPAPDISAAMLALTNSVSIFLDDLAISELETFDTMVSLLPHVKTQLETEASDIGPAIVGQFATRLAESEQYWRGERGAINALYRREHLQAAWEDMWVLGGEKPEFEPKEGV